ncbi:MAG: hypothetical protein SFY81_06520 [Verrucomicrobiota bacterium]|nr:hypothetical protein [Verrucomicrobiota bacterium]
MKRQEKKDDLIPQVQVTLDGAPVALDALHSHSLSGIRCHLEQLALERQRVLFSLAVNDIPVSLGKQPISVEHFNKVAGRTIGFNQLALQLVSVAEEQAGKLKGRIEEVSLQVLINDWPSARELWWKLLPDLKDPLLTLSFLPGAIERLPNGHEIGPKAIQGYIAKLVEIVEEIEQSLPSEDPVELSTRMETALLPWINQVCQALFRFHGPELM